MIAILVSMALMGQVEDLPKPTPTESFKYGYTSFRTCHQSLIKHIMADRDKFYRSVASGDEVIPEGDKSLVRGLIRQDLSETEKIIKAKETPRNLKSLAKVHFRNACDALAVLEKQNPGK